MAKTKAIRFVAPGQVEMVELATPPPGPKQALVRMLASSLCNHPELRSYRGGEFAGYGSKYPMLAGEPGHEGVGEVAATGEGVTEVAVGDLVVMTGHGGDPTHRSTLLRRVDTLAKILPEEREAKAASILEMFGCAYHCVRVGWNHT